jgi:hypothetical protein
LRDNGSTTQSAREKPRLAEASGPHADPLRRRLGERDADAILILPESAV